MKRFIGFVFLTILFISFIGISKGYSQQKTQSMQQIERRSKNSGGLLNNGKSRKAIRAEKKAEKGSASYNLFWNYHINIH